MVLFAIDFDLFFCVDVLHTVIAEFVAMNFYSFFNKPVRTTSLVESSAGLPTQLATPTLQMVARSLPEVTMYRARYRHVLRKGLVFNFAVIISVTMLRFGSSYKLR